jgi:predicted ATPase
MRIAISGTASIGKTTLIEDFLKEWPNYTKNNYTYRDVLKNHSKNTDSDVQWTILNNMIDELQKYDKNDNVIFDRCPLDNLVYSMWSNNYGKIDDAFISKCIPLVKESMRLLDIVFFIPITKVSPVPITIDNRREIDPTYIQEIDQIFKAIVQQYQYNLNNTPFFPKDDSPGIIEVFGKRDERIHLIRQYLNKDGNIIGDEGGSVFSEENLNELKELLEQQKNTHFSEQFKKEQMNILKDLAKLNQSK